MKWYEVQPAVEAGKKAHRESTPNMILHFSEECKVFMMENTDVEYNVFNPSTVVYCPTTIDLLANDWIIIEDVPEMKLFRATVGYCPHCGSLQLVNWDIDGIVTNCGNCRKPSKNVKKYDEIILDARVANVCGVQVIQIEKPLPVNDATCKIRVLIEENKVKFA